MPLLQVAIAGATALARFQHCKPRPTPVPPEVAYAGTDRCSGPHRRTAGSYQPRSPSRGSKGAGAAPPLVAPRGSAQLAVGWRPRRHEPHRCATHIRPRTRKDPQAAPWSTIGQPHAPTASSGEDWMRHGGGGGGSGLRRHRHRCRGRCAVLPAPAWPPSTHQPDPTAPRGRHNQLAGPPPPPCRLMQADWSADAAGGAAAAPTTCPAHPRRRPPQRPPAMDAPCRMGACRCRA